MIDGKVGNAITGTSSTWYCYICGDKKSEFSNISKQRSINEETYRSIPENANKSANNNKELMEMRASEKRRIQEEFKKRMGLNIDKPLTGYGSTNDVRFHIAHLYEVQRKYKFAKEAYEQLLNEKELTLDLKAVIYRQLGNE
ncbi:Lysine-specific demethylase 6A [Lucilia cuprina]|nr:Lysine-specific demethylase 6A [Lucilia cuprina]KAI8125084.1 Lysine-specific demethylase 6A [Lucilia cuprina]